MAHPGYVDQLYDNDPRLDGLHRDRCHV
jgi:hypothetical protein